MDANELKGTLDKHQKWLDNEPGGERANLSRSNLSRSNLSGSNLSRSDLDYSTWPLWCGSLKAHVDDRIAIQLLYHTLSVVKYSPYVSEELKRTLLTRSVIEIANHFHHVGECGELKAYDEAAE